MNIGLFFLEMEEGREHNFVSLISCVSLFGLLGIGEFLFFPRKKKNEEKTFFSGVWVAKKVWIVVRLCGKWRKGREDGGFLFLFFFFMVYIVLVYEKVRSSDWLLGKWMEGWENDFAFILNFPYVLFWLLRKWRECRERVIVLFLFFHIIIDLKP